MTPETFPPRAIPEVPPLGPPGPESAEAQRILDHGAAETREAIRGITDPFKPPLELPPLQPIEQAHGPPLPLTPIASPGIQPSPIQRLPDVSPIAVPGQSVLDLVERERSEFLGALDSHHHVAL